MTMTSLQSHPRGDASLSARIPSAAGALALKGERLCLDFTNTKSGRNTSSERDHLQTFEDLLAWANHAGILSNLRWKELRAAASRKPSEAQLVLREALELREALHRIFSAIAEQSQAPEQDVVALNLWIEQSYPHLKLRISSGRFVLGWPESEGELASILWPIVESATELLTQARPDRIKRCPGWDCGWLFLDTTKNGMRRWCDMATCGNRVKSRLHYRRRRDASIRCEGS